MQLATIKPRVEFDPQRLPSVAKAIGVTVQFLGYDQARLLALDLISITAPAKKLFKKNEKPKGSDKKLGENAVNSDLMRLFYPITDAAAMVSWVQKGGEITRVTNSGKMVIDPDQLKATKSKMDEWVKTFRSTRTGRIKFPRHNASRAWGGKLLVPSQVLKGYIKAKIKDVGTLKAGWLQGARYFASKCNGKAKTAPWIEANLMHARGTAGGLLSENGSGKMFIENTSNFASIKTQKSAIAFALMTRQKDLNGNVEKRSQRILDQFKGMGAIKPIKA